MTDPNNAAPATTLDKVKALLASPAVQEPLKAAFSAGGFGYLFLTQHGQNAQQIAWEYQGLIAFGPGIAVWIINQLQKTKAAIVTQAAKIIAAKDGQTGTPAVEKATSDIAKAVLNVPGVQVAVDTKVAPASMTAVAMDKTVDNVNPM